jgi:hypothetical protein
MWFMRSSQPLAAAGVSGLIVVNYLGGLLIETLMSVRLASSEPAGDPAGRPSSHLSVSKGSES